MHCKQYPMTKFEDVMMPSEAQVVPLWIGTAPSVLVIVVVVMLIRMDELIYCEMHRRLKTPES